MTICFPVDEWRADRRRAALKQPEVLLADTEFTERVTPSLVGLVKPYRVARFGAAKERSMERYRETPPIL